MSRTMLRWAALLALFAAGCGSGNNSAPGGNGSGDGQPVATDGGGGTPAADGTADGKPYVPPPPPPPKIVEVKLSAAHAATCLVKQGDALPDAELPDLDGNAKKLSELLGACNTVVVFWSAANRYSPNLLFDMAEDVAGKHEGVNVVGISVGDSADDAKSMAEDNDVNYPVLVDTDKAYFAKVATDLSPRIYLLDAGGKILWFSVDYQTATKQEFHNALEFVTAGAKPEE